jgi:hypothetical protein
MLYITKEELADLYKTYHEGEELSSQELEEAVSDYNGRLDNFADALLEEILEEAREGNYKEEEAE